MSALTGDTVHGVWIDPPARERTRLRKKAEHLTGKRFPPGKAEIDAYLLEGLTPPTN